MELFGTARGTSAVGITFDAFAAWWDSGACAEKRHVDDDGKAGTGVPVNCAAAAD